MDTAISLKDVSVRLGDSPILKDITFDVPKGATTAIIGPNGAGKSILLKTILNQIKKSAGSIDILGTPNEQYRKIAPKVSYIPQKIFFDDTFPLTLEGLFSLKTKRWLGLSQKDDQKMKQLLHRVGINIPTDTRLYTLSGGQLQRVLIAYSLMDDPELVIMDEPAAGIDITGQETIYELLKRIQQEEKITLLLVSHELDIVIRYARQVICLNQKLICAGVPHEVLSDDILQKMYGTPVAHHIHTANSHADGHTH